MEPRDAHNQICFLHQVNYWLENLKYGKCHPVKETYTPDSFGFNWNFPQILKHNECDALIYWIGIDENHIKNDVLNIWKGIDGTEIYTYNLFKYWYGGTYSAFYSIYE